MTLKRPARAARRRAKTSRAPSHLRLDVTRGEFNRVLDRLAERETIIDVLLHNQEIQLKRIAQLQAEIDGLRSALARTRRP